MRCAIFGDGIEVTFDSHPYRHDSMCSVGGEGGYLELIAMLETCRDILHVQYSIINRLDPALLSKIRTAPVDILCTLFTLKYAFYIETGLIMKAICPEWFQQHMDSNVQQQLMQLGLYFEDRVLFIRHRLYFPSLLQQLLDRIE